MKALLPNIMEKHLRAAAEVEEAVRAAFAEMEAEVNKVLLEAFEAEPTSVEISSGTTACVVLWKEDDVWVANAGDCRAVLCVDGLGDAVTRDHAPDKNPDEAERLKQLGVEVNDGYVDGQVAVSRAFGDVNVQTGRKVPGVLAEPDVFKLDMHDTTEFLVLGSDGVFDPLKDRSVATHARVALKKSQSPQEAAAMIIQKAGELSQLDNSSAVVIVFKMPPQPPPRRALNTKFKLTEPPPQP